MKLLNILQMQVYTFKVKINPHTYARNVFRDQEIIYNYTIIVPENPFLKRTTAGIISCTWRIRHFLQLQDGWNFNTTYMYASCLIHT